MPLVLRICVVLGIPFIAALTVTGTYLGKEALVAAAWVAIATVGFLFVRPMVGITVMTVGFMLAAYPGLLTSMGFLSVNNILGLGFVFLLLAHILDTRDLSFLKQKPIIMFLLIVVIFWISTIHSGYLFPLLQVSHGKRIDLDRTSEMFHDLVTRVVFLIFIFTFVRSRRDIKTFHLAFFISLFAAVPSAIQNWMNGTLISGFRAAASLTSGANPNRLAMICLIEVACWYYWAQWRPGSMRRVIALGAIVASILVVFASGSRSGLLGCGVLFVLLQTGPRKYRVPFVYVALFVLVGIVGVLAIVPPDSLQRMINFEPDRHTYGYHSTLQRIDTIWLGFQMLHDHPLFGIGLGNFREVSRQVYLDPYYRPPHNSYLWAMTEGGLLGILSYLLLFFFVIRELWAVQRMASRDPELAHIAAALRCAAGSFAFFSVFADMWTNPVTYVLIGQIMVLRRHMESLPPRAEVVPVPVGRAGRRLAPVAVAS